MIQNKKTGTIWYNGTLVSWDDAKTHVLSHGLNFCGSVFEGIRVYNNCPFYQREHVSRLFKSAELLDFKIPYNQQIIEEAITLLIQTEKINAGYVRPLAWISNENPALFNKNTEVSLAIITLNLKGPFSEEEKSLGLRLKTSSFIRPAYNLSLAQSKASGHYLISCRAMNEARVQGFDDALILDSRGYVTEASGANLFMIKKDTLYTPIADCFLNGITRQIVMKLAKECGMPLIENRITPQELNEADEIFLTGTAYEIMPVRQIDERLFKAGAQTKYLRTAFDELTRTGQHSHSL